MRAAKSQTSLRICADLPELSLPDNKISTEFHMLAHLIFLLEAFLKIYILFTKTNSFLHKDCVTVFDYLLYINIGQM